MTIMYSRLLQGFGIAFFFLPIVQISLSEIPKDRYASASGLFHFVRILIGSGFGTSLAIELWTRLEIFHHARLTESNTIFDPITTQFYQQMENTSSVFTPAVVSGLLDMQTEQQAYMLSTNDLAILSAWGFLALIPVIYLCKRVAAAPESSPQAVH